MDETGSIHFFFEDIQTFDFDSNKHREWIFQIISTEKFAPGVLNYIITNDDALHKLNVKYLNHDTFTDIITFDYRENHESLISGDIYISIDRIRENSKKFKTQFFDELRRVLAHGVLHLLGYNDYLPDEKDIMKQKEDYYLNIFPYNK